MSKPIAIPQMGIVEIDDEHAGLLDCLTRLELFIAKGHGFAASIDAVLALRSYAIAHFKHEEAFLRVNTFPNLQEHIDQHRVITNYVDKLYDSVLNGEEIESSLVEMMREWILQHIGVDDMEFALHFGTAAAANEANVSVPCRA